MKTIGLIGGMSWESTVPYYQIINETVKKDLGGLHSAKCLLYSVDFAEIEACQSSGDWDKSAQILSEAACALKRGGADFIVICTNTMHKVVEQIRQAAGLPVLHIAEVTAECLKANQISKAALLGTQYTMEQDFYKAKLIEAGIEVVIPNAAERKKVNDTIYQELCLGRIVPESKASFLALIQRLNEEEGAQAVILGCTEIGLLVNQQDTKVPLFDTTAIHAQAAARYALK